MQQVGVTADRLNGSSIALAAVEPGACTSEGFEFRDVIWGPQYLE